MRRILLILLFAFASRVQAQFNVYYRTVDSTNSLNRLNGAITRGTLIKTSTTGFYEINDNVNRLLPTLQPAVVVYEDSGRYLLRIEGIDSLLSCIKVREVIESNIEGDFKGWDGTSTFKLTNAQEWQQDHRTPTVTFNLYSPAVFIYLTPAGYKMKIEGLNEDPIFVKKIH